MGIGPDEPEVQILEQDEAAFGGTLETPKRSRASAIMANEGLVDIYQDRSLLR